MGKKKRTMSRLRLLQYGLTAVVAVALAVVLILAYQSPNDITRSRVEGDYTIVTDVETEEICEGDTVQNRFRFVLSEIGHAETLAFFVNHHEVTVSIGGECVYRLDASQEDVFATNGAAWVMIPLYESDAGKEVCVTLTPLYRNYRVTEREFLVGSEIAVHNVTLHRAMPVLVLSLCVIFAGVLLLCLAIYHTVKGMPTGRLYTLAMMVISAGFWRLLYDRVACLLFPNRSVLIYTLSILSLMAVAFSMLNSIEADGKAFKWQRWCSCGYSVLYLVLLILQIAGIADLRQTLKLVHLTIVLSAAAFVVSGIRQIRKPNPEHSKKANFGWMLGVGVAIDLFLYYFGESSMTMIFTLVAILCYSVLEGIGLMIYYVEQKKALEEMETQLKLSRTTTMMSQIRSHFVFNLLNAISGMCKYDPEKADETVVRFARYLRSNIDIMENDKSIPFPIELQRLEDYVVLEQVRFGDKLDFLTDIETEDFYLPPLILQPVVENAIKHGISKKMENGTIILHTHDEGDRILITVEDDGVGFEPAELDKEESVGIRNIRFRLQHLVNGTLEIQSEPGVGTVVTITIPKQEEQP